MKILQMYECLFFLLKLHHKMCQVMKEFQVYVIVMNYTLMENPMVQIQLVLFRQSRSTTKQLIL